MFTRTRRNRRRFQPTLESLSLRITPSDITPIAFPPPSIDDVPDIDNEFPTFDDGNQSGDGQPSSPGDIDLVECIFPTAL